MQDQNQQTNQSSKSVWVIPVAALAIVVAIAVVWRVMYIYQTKENKPQEQSEPNKLGIPSPQIIKAAVTVEDIIRVRQHWDPAFTGWFGKQSPDFELTDIEGTKHKLSQYRGKTVILVFWATWCGPCKQEIPGLINLRKEFSPEKLSIIAISFENPDLVKRFLKQVPVNYTVIAANQGSVSSPFNMINAIPAAFFIDKDGIIRLASEGFVLESEVKMILKAIDS